MGYNDDINWGGIFVIVLVVGGLTGGIVLITSWGKVDTNEVGFLRNRWTGEIDLENVYTTGRHWKGASNQFITFSTLVQSITFNPGDDATDMQLTSRTKDGLAISLDISFQYKLIIEDIAKLYKDYQKEYESTYVRVSRSTLRDVVANYTAIEFFTDRAEIGSAMEEVLRIDLEGVYGELVMLQLTRVDLPDSFEQALEEVEVARQQYEIAVHNQAAQLVEAETQILLAQKLAEQKIIEAQGSADALIIEMTAYAEALNITITAEAEMLLYLADTLGLNSTELLSYLWIQAITEHTSALLIIGQSTPEILINS